jgi:general secretion pathway protein K
VTRRREQGFALLIVLWSLVLIALLITQILASGRTAASVAANMRASAEARARADGAIYETIYHLLSNGGDHWAADGGVHRMQGNGVAIAVRAESLAGRINPNLASTALLAGLMQACGTSPAQAQQLAQSIIEWRSPPTSPKDADALLAAYRRAGLPFGPPGRPFSDLGELAYVIGMQPALLAKAMPVMSLYQSGDPDPAQSGALVREALALSGQTGTVGNSYNGTFPVVTIEAEVDAAGATVRREAIVSLDGADAPVPFQLLALADAHQ